MLLSLFSLQGTMALKAQEGFYLSFSGNYGPVLPHHKEIEYLLNDKARGFEISYSTRNLNGNFWDSIYHSPSGGLGFFCR